MKKALLIVVLAAGLQQLKAQQIIKPLPEMKITDGLTGDLLQPKTDSPLSAYSKLNPADSLAHFPGLLNSKAIVVYSQMPVAKIDYSNVDHMPVYNPAATGMHYDMLIKKVEVSPAVVTVDKVTP